MLTSSSYVSSVSSVTGESTLKCVCISVYMRINTHLVRGFVFRMRFLLLLLLLFNNIIVNGII